MHPDLDKFPYQLTNWFPRTKDFQFAINQLRSSHLPYVIKSQPMVAPGSSKPTPHFAIFTPGTLSQEYLKNVKQLNRRSIAPHSHRGINKNSQEVR